MKKWVCFLIILVDVVFMSACNTQSITNSLDKNVYNSSVHQGAYMQTNETGEITVFNINEETLFHLEDSYAWRDVDQLIRIQNNEGNVGVLNVMGDIMISPSWKQVYPFYNGYAVVRNSDEKYGVIDNLGNIMVEPKWDRIDTDDREGLDNEVVFTHLDHCVYLVDIRDGSVLFEGIDNLPSYYFSNGLAKILTGVGYSFINYSGELVFSLSCDSVTDFNREYAIIEKNKKWYVIDSVGHTIGEIDVRGYLKYIWNNYFVFHSLEEKQTERGIINEDRDYLFCIKDRKISKIDTGYWNQVWCCLKDDNEIVRFFALGTPYSLDKKDWYLLDDNGMPISDKSYDDYDSISSYCDGIAIVNDKGRYGYIDLYGNTLFPPRYDIAMPFYNEKAIAAIQMDSKYGLYYKLFLLNVDGTINDIGDSDLDDIRITMKNAQEYYDCAKGESYESFRGWP